MKLPDFICIGVAKCGTTPLWYNLDKHPDITMATKNARDNKTEMYFWNSYLYTEKGLKWYSQFFKGSRVTGEKTPKYIRSKLALKRMKDDIPNVKLIICMRHPVERAYSAYKMHFKKGKIRGDFTWKHVMNFIKKGGYINPIKNNVLPFFDRNQIHFCITEWMKKNTVEEMNKLYDFLDVPRVDIERRVINITKEVKEMKTRGVRPGEMMKIRRAEPWYRVYDQYPETVSGKLRKKALAYCKPKNEELFDFLGYEIEEWKV